MKTIKILGISVISIFLFAACQRKIEESGIDATETRTVANNFNAVLSSGAYDIFINYAPTDGEILLEGDSNILDKILISVKNNRLIIQQKSGFYTSKGNAAKITLNAKNLEALSLTGSGSIEADGIQEVEEFNVELSGSGNIIAGVNADKTNLSLTGSGNIEIMGETRELGARITGSGDINAFKLSAANADVGISGSGDLEITVNDNLEVGSSGSGKVHYKGNPAKTKIDIVGSGKVIDAN